VLAELAAQLCSDSPALRATAEKCMAAHKPLSHELVERALLSPDLLPCILGPLETEDGAAAAVCSQWLAGWTATNEAPWRRRLKQVPLDLPDELCISDELQMTGTSDGRLVVFAADEVHILDRSMRVLQTLVPPSVPPLPSATIAADDASIFICSGAVVIRITQDLETRAAEYRLDGHCFCYPALAPSARLLFCVMFEDTLDEIIGLDAQTLQLRHRFGLGLLNGAQQLCVVADELFVCDTHNHRLQVFSLTGEHRRSIVGEWWWPEKLCFAKDRLYLVEQDYLANGEWDEGYREGRRIIVLSLHGDILQVVTSPVAFQSICCFDHKLLASFTNGVDARGMIALQGL
jgi:hypothetical protein